MEVMEHLEREVLIIQRNIALKAMKQKELKKGFKNAQIQKEIAKNRTQLAHMYWVLAQAKANVRDYVAGLNNFKQEAK